jgi:hypothetical protein
MGEALGKKSPRNIAMGIYNHQKEAEVAAGLIVSIARVCRNGIAMGLYCRWAPEEVAEGGRCRAGR